MLIDQAIHVMRAGGRVRRLSWSASRASLEWRGGPVSVGDWPIQPAYLLSNDWTANDWVEVSHD